MRVLLVYPQNPDTFWSFKHALRFVSKNSTFPPLGLLTIASMLPADWEFRLIDLNVKPLRESDILWADYVMISAMIVHRESVHEIVAKCQACKRPTIAGGPLFTTGHEQFPAVQHFVLGEAEDIMAQLATDMLAGTVKKYYKALNRPDVTKVPIPRWDLIQFHHYVSMAVQFSRGCPFDCEFCDIIVMNGRVPRTKTPAQLIAELEALRLAGWKDMVFIVDDNFIGNKKRTKELLREMIAWRAQVRPTMGFFTEASVNLADDAELCQLMVQAGFKKVFVGIETPSPESLQECHKLQNKGRDLVQSIQVLQRAGMEVMGGFIVGFDNDHHDIFKRQFEFIQSSGVVTAMVGLLQALPQTRLYERLMSEGRLESAATGNNTEAVLNFKTKLNREFLQNGYRELMRRLYEPKTYYQRIKTFLEHHEPRGPRLRLSRSDLQAFARSFWLLGIWDRGRHNYWKFFWSTLLRRPRQFRYAIELAVVGYHFRRIASRL
ncbi:MAG TPA: DUF4070 domain-containing protein [Clostridia bacterium]|nr:DUF4070 domain-containing protein [Clostridia bacterium]